MQTQPFIKNYAFTKNRNFINCPQTRVQFTTVNGKTFSIRAASKVRWPTFIKNVFWSKVTLSDNTTFYINKNSLVKWTTVPKTYIKNALKTNRTHFDPLLRTLSKMKDVHAVLRREEPKSPKQAAIDLVEKIEHNRQKYIAKVNNEENFVEEWQDKRILIATKNPKTQQIDFYIKLHRILGSGSYKEVSVLLDYERGEADLALSKSSNAHHIKITKRGVDFAARLEDSERIMKVECFIEQGISRDEHGTFVSAADDAKTYLVTKRYHGTFKGIAHSKKIPFETKLTLFTYILEGVVDMHEHQILHRDLKFDNVLYKRVGVNEFDIKLIDIDWSCYFHDEKSLKQRNGTKNHMAPEMLDNKGGGFRYPEKIDSWSLGIMLYTLCENDAKFIHGWKDLKTDEQVKQLVSGAKSLSFQNLTPDNPLIPIIQGLLDLDPAKRLLPEKALDGIRAYLYH